MEDLRLGLHVEDFKKRSNQELYLYTSRTEYVSKRIVLYLLA